MLFAAHHAGHRKLFRNATLYASTLFHAESASACMYCMSSISARQCMSQVHEACSCIQIASRSELRETLLLCATQYCIQWRALLLLENRCRDCLSCAAERPVKYI